MIKRKSAAKYVKFLGFVSDKELVSLLNGSLGFVYASLDEGFGLQGLESMAAGTLVLASDIAIFKEIYKKNAIYFDPLSVEEIKETMKSVLMMPSKNREKLVKDGKRFVKTYSWEDMATKTLEVYRQFG
jgi:glycosyltransferase involved in cell wall biosynthesis